MSSPRRDCNEVWEVIEFVIPAPPSHDVDDGVQRAEHLEITFEKTWTGVVRSGLRLRSSYLLAFYDIVTIAERVQHVCKAYISSS